MAAQLSLGQLPPAGIFRLDIPTTVFYNIAGLAGLIVPFYFLHINKKFKEQNDIHDKKLKTQGDIHIRTIQQEREDTAQAINVLREEHQQSANRIDDEIQQLRIAADETLSVETTTIDVDRNARDKITHIAHKSSNPGNVLHTQISGNSAHFTSTAYNTPQTRARTRAQENMGMRRNEQ